MTLLLSGHFPNGSLGMNWAWGWDGRPRPSQSSVSPGVASNPRTVKGTSFWLWLLEKMFPSPLWTKKCRHGGHCLNAERGFATRMKAALRMKLTWRNGERKSKKQV